MRSSSGHVRCAGMLGRWMWRRLVAVLVLVVFIWSITVLNVTFIYTSNRPRKDSAVLQVGGVYIFMYYVDSKTRLSVTPICISI